MFPVSAIFVLSAAVPLGSVAGSKFYVYDSFVTSYLEAKKVVV